MSSPSANVARYKQHEAGDIDPSRTSSNSVSSSSLVPPHRRSSSTVTVAPQPVTTVVVQPQKQVKKEYEFTEDQEQIIDKTSVNMMTTAIASAGMALFVVIFAIISVVRGTMSFFGLVVQFGYAFIFMIVCFYTWRSSKFLHAVANSEGRDITFLMAFMLNLQRLFQILKYVLLFACVLILIACILNVILSTQNAKDKCGTQ